MLDTFNTFVLKGCNKYGLNYSIISRYGAMEWKALIRIYLQKGYLDRAKWAFVGYKKLGGKETFRKIKYYAINKRR